MKINKYEPYANFQGTVDERYIQGNCELLRRKLGQLHPNTKLSISRVRSNGKDRPANTEKFNWNDFKDYIVFSNSKIHSKLVLSPEVQFPKDVYLTNLIHECFESEDSLSVILENFTNNNKVEIKDIDRMLFNNIRGKEKITKESLLGTILPEWIRKHLNTRYQKRIDSLAEQFGVILGDGETETRKAVKL